MSNNVTIIPAGGTFADYSGTIAVNATSQQLCPYKGDRKYFLLQNLSTGDLYLNWTSAATATTGSYRVPAGATFIIESSFQSPELINIYGALAGQAFTCKVG